ncbi:MAG TPA: hypothetical protein ENH62_10500 [Marinobacter sp.]|nr:hypothetical protein [Marinobacter sp.]
MGKDADKAVNIILQHWMGDLDALAILSNNNISRYARKVGADYKLLRGDVFREGLSPQCQKMIMLDERWDDYDTVLMLDMDMFARKGIKENVFEHEGVGLHEPMQEGCAKKMHYMFPNVGNLKYSYWGGAIWKLDRELRQLLRAGIHGIEMNLFTDEFYDEGIMHGLAVLAKVKGRYFPNSRWCKSSYELDVADSYMIHVRHRKLIKGVKVPSTKMMVYEGLAARGLIA